ncbi:MAG: hypothetical protein ACKO83_13465, partial [Roseiflexaceae bacterium]
MQFTLLSTQMTSPQAIKVFWDTLDDAIRKHMLKQLYQSRELIDKRSKLHAYDELLVQRLRFRARTITEKPLDWRIERILLQCDAQPRIIHDICRRYLTTIHAERFQQIQQMANGSEPEPANGKYPAEWYLRIVDYLRSAVPPPLPCMLIFSMFAECEGRTEALKDTRYQQLWIDHCEWSAARASHASPAIPESLIVTPPAAANPPKPVPVRQAAVKPAPVTKVTKPVVRAAVLAPPPALPEVPTSLTALQYLINRAVEDSCAHIKGALSHEQMRDALAEVLRLNSDTVQHYYHFG